MQVFLFTDTFPYGFAEPFLESEIPFLAKHFDRIHLIPLSGSGRQRDVPDNVRVWQPFLRFSPKNKVRLLLGGLFNCSPLIFALKEFFAKKIYKNPQHLWQFFTSLLLFRAMFSKAQHPQLPKGGFLKESGRGKIFFALSSFLKSPFKQWGAEIDDKFYFYWGDKAVMLAPFFKKHFPDNAVFARFHGSDLYEEAHQGYIPFRENTLAAVDVFLPVSRNGKDYLQNRYKINGTNIRQSPLGVFDRGENPPAAPSEIFHLVSCSNIIPVKRLHLLVEALHLLNFPLRWTHIGAGNLLENIKTMAATLPKNIEYELKGQMSNSEVMAFYAEQHIDLFINVSASEGLPVSIMEALSFGIPVVATDVGGTSELVDDRVGELLPADVSPACIATAVKRFSASTESSVLRANARQRWAERCNAEKNYADFAEMMRRP
jgi:glycosyltransferase involved in cell wall biosynthesis